MEANFSDVTIKMTGEEFKAFKLLVSNLNSLLLVTPTQFNKFYDGLKNVDIDVATSLTTLKSLISYNYNSDFEISKFLQHLTTL